MLAVAGLGAALFFRREGPHNAHWLWIGVAVGYTVLIWAYRCFGVSHDFHGFHYLFVFIVLAAVFFGEASDVLLDRINPGSQLKSAVIVALEILLIHQTVFWGILNSRLDDVVFYGRVRALNEALAEVHGTERVAVTGIDRESVVAAHGLGALAPGMHSKLIEALTDDYVAVDSADVARLVTSLPPGERPVGSVVSVEGVRGIPTALGPFEPHLWLAETGR